jgi:hypothetical protein
LYTGIYSGAANVMRLYICSMFIMAIEISSILIVYQQGPYVMRTSMLMILMTLVVGMGAKYVGLVGVAFGGLAAILLGAIRNYYRVIRITNTSFRKIQHWSTLGVIVLAASAGSIGAQRVVSLQMASYGALSQLFTALALNILLYAGVLILFRHGWLIVRIWRG